MKKLKEVKIKQRIKILIRDTSPDPFVRELANEEIEKLCKQVGMTTTEAIREFSW